jgi:hypothetical protein
VPDRADAGGEKVVVVEAELLMIEDVDAADEQATADKEKHGERNLSADAQDAQAIVLPA